jgi:hypothetical protein
MLKIRCAVLGCLLLLPALAPVARGQQPIPPLSYARQSEPPAPTTQIQMDIVIAELNLPKAEQNQILKALAKSWTKAKKHQLAQNGCVVWTADSSQAMFALASRLRERNMARFLACPKLVTLSGKQATFLTGGQVAVPQPSGSDAEPCSVQFEEFGLRFGVVPAVAGCKVHLAMEFSHGEVAQQAPHLTITEKGVKTFAELYQGQCVFILMPASFTAPGKATTPATHMLYMVSPHVVAQL